MADCGDAPYQAIEYRGLFDLKDAQVVRAEIVTIDRIALTAEVTLLDSCDQDDWLDIEAVPFFYHCETSTGTVEDLERGHKAFVDGDMVYILLTKENGDEPAQAYIIGHVDIRGTRVCTTDILLITQRFRNNSVWYVVYILINPVLGTLFDIAAFENFDGSSPAKPSSALGVYSTAVENWVNYNFVSVTNTIDVPFTRTLEQTVFSSGHGYIEHAAGLPAPSSFTDYTGDYSVTVDAPGDACYNFDTGNEQYSTAWDEYEAFTDIVGGYGTWTGTELIDHYGVTTYHPSGNTQSCAIFWDTTDFNIFYEIYSGGPYLWTLTDTVTSTDIEIPVRMTFSVSWNSSSVYNLALSTLYVGTVKEYVYSYLFEFSSIGLQNLEFSHTYSGEASTNVSIAIGGVLDSDDDYKPDDVDGEVGISDALFISGAASALPSLWAVAAGGGKTAIGSAVLEGDDGVYTVFGSCLRKQWKTVTSGASQVQVVGPVFYDNVGPSWNTNARTILDGTANMLLVPVIAATVTIYDSTFDLLNPISISQCFSSVDVERSTALAETIQLLFTYIRDAYTQGIAAYELEAFSSNYVGTYTGLAYGPTYRLIKKKV